MPTHKDTTTCSKKLEQCREEKWRLKAQLSLKQADPWSGVATTFIQGVVWLVLGVLFLLKTPPTIVEIASVLAGKKTIAKFSLIFNVSLVISITLVFSIGWALMERHHRKKQVKRLSDELIQARKVIDRGRMSSGLTPSGDTNKEDLP